MLRMICDGLVFWSESEHCHQFRMDARPLLRQIGRSMALGPVILRRRDGLSLRRMSPLSFKVANVRMCRRRLPSAAGGRLFLFKDFALRLIVRAGGQVEDVREVAMFTKPRSTHRSAAVMMPWPARQPPPRTPTRVLPVPEKPEERLWIYLSSVLSRVPNPDHVMYGNTSHTRIAVKGRSNEVKL